MEKVRLFWSRKPGEFVNKLSGEKNAAVSAAVKFHGSVQDWYMTLIETIIDCAEKLRRSRGAQKIMGTGVDVSPDVLTILRTNILYRSSSNDKVAAVGVIAGRIVVNELSGQRNIVTVRVTLDNGQTATGEVVVLDLPVF